MKAIEILEELHSELDDGSLKTKLTDLIATEKEECNRLAGECGNLDTEVIQDPELGDYYNDDLSVSATAVAEEVTE